MKSIKNLLGISTLVSVFILNFSIAAEASKNPRGEANFKLCIFCHGQNGQGNKDLLAPAIAGLPAWYVEAQVNKFKNGARGFHPEDAAGLRMRPMAKTLNNDEDVKAVAEYVASLSPQKQATTLGGDTTKGQMAFATCIACHGADAMGNQALNAPPLAHTQDWYQIEQLKKFKKGMRGKNAALDPNGATMAGMANTLVDEQAMKDVLAYIHSLK